MKKILLLSFLLIIVLVLAGCKNNKENDKAIEEKNSSSVSQVGNPVAGMSKEEAYRIAEELDEGTNMGSWSTMSSEEFLNWWKESNNITE